MAVQEALQRNPDEERKDKEAHAGEHISGVLRSVSEKGRRSIPVRVGRAPDPEADEAYLNMPWGHWKEVVPSMAEIIRIMEERQRETQEEPSPKNT